MDDSKKPAHEIRLGAVKGTVWLNKTKFGESHRVQIARLYRDEKGEWHSTSSFGRDDLCLVAKVADMLHTWICLSMASRSASGQAEKAN